MLKIGWLLVPGELGGEHMFPKHLKNAWGGMARGIKVCGTCI